MISKACSSTRDAGRTKTKTLNNDAAPPSRGELLSGIARCQGYGVAKQQIMALLSTEIEAERSRLAVCLLAFTLIGGSSATAQVIPVPGISAPPFPPPPPSPQIQVPAGPQIGVAPPSNSGALATEFL